MAESRPRILKHGDAFGVFDHHGDILPNVEAHGLYYRDTRHLSGFQLLLAGCPPLLLSSNLLSNNAALTVHLTNQDVIENGELVLPRDVLHVWRTRFLWEGRLFERLALRNFGIDPIEVDLDLAFAADFADIFEARGFTRQERGEITSFVEDGRNVYIAYSGQDGQTRKTTLRFDSLPDHLSTTEARYRLALPHNRQESLFLTIEYGDQLAPSGPGLGFFNGLKHARRPLRQVAARTAGIDTSNEIMNEVLCRSMADLSMLVTDTGNGAYPYAGVPWFSTAFGRDGLITAMQMLWVDPALARGVLRFLAANQATTTDPEADAEPGKILHETRDGELARLGVVPFRRYYGTIDATPLFVLLAGAYLERTGDLGTIRSLDENIQRALRWIEQFGDRDGDRFVEYARSRDGGLVNQGWKDSHDSVFHADGELAAGPIALVEVQGYVYAAFRAAARIARALGRSEEAALRTEQAEALRAAVEERFWSDDLDFYALALDGEKRACAVRSSNAAQLLWTGLPHPERAARIARAILSPAFFSGFGVRTLAAGEARYNPMSYHNGSVWPHDNALIALGLARYGFKNEALQILEGLFDAAANMDLRRLPELFCGFRRVPSSGPTLYPVACSPQAWASATPFALLQAVLGLGFDYTTRTIRFDRPRLPESLDEVRIRNLRLGNGVVDVQLRRAGSDVAVNVLRRSGDVEVTVTL